MMRGLRDRPRRLNLGNFKTLDDAKRTCERHYGGRMQRERGRGGEKHRRRSCDPTSGTHGGRGCARLLRRSSRGIRFSEHLDGNGALAFAHVCRMGLEGIVANRRVGRIGPGAHEDWIKVKNPDAPAAIRVIDG
jgi:hypothetical protein